MANQTDFQLSVNPLITLEMTQNLKSFSEQLIAYVQGGEKPKTNAQLILEKYIRISTTDLQNSHSKMTAKRISKEVLTKVMNEYMRG